MLNQRPYLYHCDGMHKNMQVVQHFSQLILKNVYLLLQIKISHNCFLKSYIEHEKTLIYFFKKNKLKREYLAKYSHKKMGMHVQKNIRYELNARIPLYMGILAQQDFKWGISYFLVEIKSSCSKKYERCWNVQIHYKKGISSMGIPCAYLEQFSRFLCVGACQSCNTKKVGLPI